jgi:hypothetical protein
MRRVAPKWGFIMFRATLRVLKFKRTHGVAKIIKQMLAYPFQ